MDDENTLPVETDPFAGLMQGRRLNPALGVQAPAVMPERSPDSPPVPDPRLQGYVSRDDLEVGINVRAPRRVREAAKMAALKRGISLAAYIEFLIRRDTGV